MPSGFSGGPMFSRTKAPCLYSPTALGAPEAGSLMPTGCQRWRPSRVPLNSRPPLASWALKNGSWAAKALLGTESRTHLEVSVPCGSSARYKLTWTLKWERAAWKDNLVPANGRSDTQPRVITASLQQGEAGIIGRQSARPLCPGDPGSNLPSRA